MVCTTTPRPPAFRKVPFISGYSFSTRLACQNHQLFSKCLAEVQSLGVGSPSVPFSASMRSACPGQFSSPGAEIIWFVDWGRFNSFVAWQLQAICQRRKQPKNNALMGKCCAKKRLGFLCVGGVLKPNMPSRKGPTGAIEEQASTSQGQGR